MGINRNTTTMANPWLVFFQTLLQSIGKSKRINPVHNDKYNPTCEYILKAEGIEKSHIASVNTRAAARIIKREYQNDKGIKVNIFQYTYDSDRYQGGKIVEKKLVR